MALEYFYREPENVLCVKVSLPVVLAEEELQVVVDNVTHLPELAKKVDHIDARLMDLDCRPIFVHEDGDRWISIIEREGWDQFGWHFSAHGRQPVVKKLLVEGTLHKQIFYVNREDNVRHFAEDIDFAKEITLADPAPVVDEDNVFCRFWKRKIDVRWDLRGASRLSQTGVIIIRVKVVEERQVWVQVCPRREKMCPRGVNLLMDGGFEQWGSNTDPLFWGASNVVRSEEANTGSFSAELGADPGQDAAVFQTVNNVVPGFEYRLCFYARENVAEVAPFASFTLEAELSFFDEAGAEIRSRRESFLATQIPDEGFRRFCIDATAPEDAQMAVVRFTFIPNANNTSMVKIDDVSLECIRAQDTFGIYYEER